MTSTGVDRGGGSENGRDRQRWVWQPETYLQVSVTVLGPPGFSVSFRVGVAKYACFWGPSQEWLAGVNPTLAYRFRN